ncbi:MAG TPA: GcrA family cell cycle regulator [Gemmatimonadaceae bacterium]|nr:GcrA family cell cycle regulator [Gemmatimonadaceae bacterium]
MLATKTARTRTRCKGTRSDGKPCRAWPVPGRVGYCQAHDPELSTRHCFWPVGDGPMVEECGKEAVRDSCYCLQHTRIVLEGNAAARARWTCAEELLPGW